jgi:hypothetical protein
VLNHEFSRLQGLKPLKKIGWFTAGLKPRPSVFLKGLCSGDGERGVRLPEPRGFATAIEEIKRAGGDAGGTKSGKPKMFVRSLATAGRLWGRQGADVTRSVR